MILSAVTIQLPEAATVALSPCFTIRTSPPSRSVHLQLFTSLAKAKVVADYLLLRLCRLVIAVVTDALCPGSRKCLRIISVDSTPDRSMVTMLQMFDFARAVSDTPSGSIAPIFAHCSERVASADPVCLFIFRNKESLSLHFKRTE